MVMKPKRGSSPKKSRAANDFITAFITSAHKLRPLQFRRRTPPIGPGQPFADQHRRNASPLPAQHRGQQVSGAGIRGHAAEG